MLHSPVYWLHSVLHDPCRRKPGNPIAVRDCWLSSCMGLSTPGKQACTTVHLHIPHTQTTLGTCSSEHGPHFRSPNGMSCWQQCVLICRACNGERFRQLVSPCAIVAAHTTGSSIIDVLWTPAWPLSALVSPVSMHGLPSNGTGPVGLVLLHLLHGPTPAAPPSTPSPSTPKN